jgi:ankyrin repeat protein
MQTRQFNKIVLLFSSLCMIYAKGVPPEDTSVYRTVNDDKASAEDIKTKLQEVIAKGEDINADLGGGFRALHYAVLRNREHAHQGKVVQFLVDAKANPHIENCDNRTPLDLASGRGKCAGSKRNEELIKILKSSACTEYVLGRNRKTTATKTRSDWLRIYNDDNSLNCNYPN